MKTIIFLFVMLIATTGFSQTYLTNGQVYDFNVGDIIQGGYHSSGPFGYYSMLQTKTIIGKTYSINYDTIFYTIIKINYTPPDCETCDPVISTDTIIQTITHLAYAAPHNNQTTCLGTRDTMYYDFCNKQVWARYPDPNTDTGCFEPIHNTTKFIKGLGGPYYNIFEPQGPASSEYTLIYYLKYPDSCGTFVSSVDEEQVASINFNVFPNPACDYIQIESSEKFIYYDIMYLSGKVYVSTKLINNSIDISGLQSGIYLFNFYTSDYKIVTKKIQKL